MREFEQLRETWDYDTQELVSDFIDVGDRVVVRTILHTEVNLTNRRETQ